MRPRNVFSVFALPLLLFLPSASAFAQLRGGVGGARIGGAGNSASTARGLASPRSGLGTRSNPIANPAPSLTPHEVLNPRGSLSAGQVVNPKASLNRPRSGGSLPANNPSNPPNAAKDPSARPLVGDNPTSGGAAVSDNSVLNAITPALKAVPAGEKILESVVDLDSKIEEVAPNKDWPERLSLDDLRTVPVFSDQPAGDAQRAALEKILKSYQAVAKDEQSSKINQLPEFTETLKSIEVYLSPIEDRKPKTVAQPPKQSTSPFQQLAGNLRSYKNGESWVQYLVPPELPTAEGEDSLSKEQLQNQLKRFAKVADDPFYKKVTSLPGFNPAHDAIKAMANVKR